MPTRLIRSRRGAVSRIGVTAALAIVTGLTGTAAAAAPGRTLLPDRDVRTAFVGHTAEQVALVHRLGATARWTRFGTPSSLIRARGFLATGIRGDTATEVARTFLAQHNQLFRLSDRALGRLELVRDSRLGTRGHAVMFRQTFGGLQAAEGGLVTVGLVGDNVAYVSSSLTSDTALAAEPEVSAETAWLTAARDVGFGATSFDVRSSRASGGWTLMAVRGLSQPARARLVAVPTPTRGVRPAWETLFVDERAGAIRAYTHFVDAATGEVLIRRDLVEQSHPAAAAFTGTMPPTDGACAPDAGPWTVSAGETIGSIAVAVEATLTTNDSVLQLVRDGQVVASQDTLFSPEALAYDPPDSGVGTYNARVCDFSDGAAWDAPATFTGQIAFNPVTADGNFPFPPKWKVFPAFPQLGSLSAYPWGYPSTDTRELWCWDSTVGSPPRTLPECQREVQNSASRAPWDFSFRTNAPTFTTVGNNAVSGEAWTSPLTPGATGFRPVSLQRDYSFPWTNTWFNSKCFTPFVPGQSHDISAAVTNLFVMHNRMHDWSYNLGFTEEHWNAQESNLGNGGPGTAEHDPLQGDAQAGGLDGGFPSYLGRDNANMVPLPDGVPPVTNMYLWQPIAGSFYSPCVDGDFDMSVIGHEYTHLIENRMIGKGGTRGGHHAGAMGESYSDLTAVEYLNEYGFVPAGVNPFAVGPYVTGNKERAIRNYGMNQSPLNFSDMGYDITGPQVHADGEIWSATNFDIRQALVAKYGAGTAQLQADCADGKLPAAQCPGNRRWIQIVFDAYLLMPTAPSMLEARDAYLAADRIRFGGANQAELWLAFARRGFGQNATSTNTASSSDVDPMPDFSSPLHQNANVTFAAVSAEDKKTAVPARVYVGRYEARVSPIADTNPATTGAANLDERAQFAPGTYEFVANAPGYGHVRFSRSLAAGGNTTVTIQLPTNWASSAKGATASGDGVRFGDLIDDTEGTNWERTGARPDVRGSQVTVDLGGTIQSVARVQVSALLMPGQNRFGALRQFEIQTCLADAGNANCTLASGWTTRLTSAADAFPGVPPRPVGPDMILRSFSLSPVKATHVRIVVLTNQCTGNTAFQGEQDTDPASGSDCREGSPGAGTVQILGDLPQVVAPRDNEVRIAELQVFSR